MRGDYQRAAEILKPLAERSREPNGIAAFFMATMYDTGLGVGVDSMRACALYIMATNTRGLLARMRRKWSAAAVPR